MVKTIYIEGNVGAGKSTFLNIVKKNVDVQVIYEPHELWENVDGFNLLEQFFLDQKRWAFTLQHYVMITRIDQLKRAQSFIHGRRFECIERSVFSGRYCFGQTLFEMEKMSHLEWALYEILWKRDVNGSVADPAGFVYLRTPAALCYERIKQRGRTAENSITLSYLQQLEKKHDEWFLHKKGLFNKKLLEVPVLVLENDQDLLSNDQLKQKDLETITQFFSKL
ncbi:deoxynucleoside kinase [Candidatus Dependentiae bacterium]|nr:deoxynucleoside kinase [Candidatus Dependentiae bacterium]